MTQQSELREQLTNIVTRNGKSARIPEILELELDDLETIITDYTNKQIGAVLDRLENKKAYDVSGSEPLINPREIEAERNRLKGDK